jgi:hypothetical protein
LSDQGLDPRVGGFPLVRNLDLVMALRVLGCAAPFLR